MAATPQFSHTSRIPASHGSLLSKNETLGLETLKHEAEVLFLQKGILPSPILSSASPQIMVHLLFVNLNICNFKQQGAEPGTFGCIPNQASGLSRVPKTPTLDLVMKEKLVQNVPL